MTNQPTIVSTTRGTATRKGHRDASPESKARLYDLLKGE